MLSFLKVSFAVPIVFACMMSTALQFSLSANASYPQEHAAWGGNGGWWGGGNHDFYDDYVWRNEEPYHAHCRTCRPYDYPCRPCAYHHPQNGRYCYRDSYIPPANEYEHNETIPGAGLYLNLEPNH